MVMSIKMRKNRFLLKLPGIILIVIFSVVSCKKDSEEEKAYDYFVSGQLAFSLPASSISAVIDNLDDQYPGLNDIKPYMTSGIKVYKIVYNTIVNGNPVQVSGLISIPDTEGAYPVLSFQHGTITENVYSPSEFPLALDNQLVEFIASMGFVVLIPDYPGFGESADIPHPYLVKEPTVQSVIDFLRTAEEIFPSEYPGTEIENEYYLLGYSQGGWAILATHRKMELDFAGEFNLSGSVCGAGPYNIYDLLAEILELQEYPMPSYIGYILNSYSFYDQFSNPLTDILKEPYASDLVSLYDGSMSLGEINNHLTTNISDLFNSDFLAAYASSDDYSSLRDAMVNNSISAWNTAVPLFLGHGDADSDVYVSATENMYDAMINAGTSPAICSKVIYSGLDHREAIVPCIRDGLLFILDLRD